MGRLAPVKQWPTTRRPHPAIAAPFEGLRQPTRENGTAQICRIFRHFARNLRRFGAAIPVVENPTSRKSQVFGQMPQF